MGGTVPDTFITYDSTSPGNVYDLTFGDDTCSSLDALECLNHPRFCQPDSSSGSTVCKRICSDSLAGIQQDLSECDDDNIRCTSPFTCDFGLAIGTWDPLSTVPAEEIACNYVYSAGQVYVDYLCRGLKIQSVTEVSCLGCQGTVMDTVDNIFCLGLYDVEGCTATTILNSNDLICQNAVGVQDGCMGVILDGDEYLSTLKCFRDVCDVSCTVAGSSCVEYLTCDGQMPGCSRTINQVGPTERVTCGGEHVTGEPPSFCGFSTPVSVKEVHCIARTTDIANDENTFVCGDWAAGTTIRFLTCEDPYACGGGAVSSFGAGSFTCMGENSCYNMEFNDVSTVTCLEEGACATVSGNGISTLGCGPLEACDGHDMWLERANSIRPEQRVPSLEPTNQPSADPTYAPTVDCTAVRLHAGECDNPEGVDAVFVIDADGSATGDEFSLLKTSVLTFLDLILTENEDSLGVISFGGSGSTINYDLLNDQQSQFFWLQAVNGMVQDAAIGTSDQALADAVAMLRSGSKSVKYLIVWVDSDSSSDSYCNVFNSGDLDGITIVQFEIGFGPTFPTCFGTWVPFFQGYIPSPLLLGYDCANNCLSGLDYSEVDALICGQRTVFDGDYYYHQAENGRSSYISLVTGEIISYTGTNWIIQRTDYTLQSIGNDDVDNIPPSGYLWRYEEPGLVTQPFQYFATCSGFTRGPTGHPSSQPTIEPTQAPSLSPTQEPSKSPSVFPTADPSATPSTFPSQSPSLAPTFEPTKNPSNMPSLCPSSSPSLFPSKEPSFNPTSSPSLTPSTFPSFCPTSEPSDNPSAEPSFNPTSSPSLTPSACPSFCPTSEPSNNPSAEPSLCPTLKPTRNPSVFPTSHPSKTPSRDPTAQPSTNPSVEPSKFPTTFPSSEPSLQPSTNPSTSPSMSPTTHPSSCPSRSPSLLPTMNPTCEPSRIPSANPSSNPSFAPTFEPSSSPTTQPSSNPSLNPSSNPSCSPSTNPSSGPTFHPTTQPTLLPTKNPSQYPSANPTINPTAAPSTTPTSCPSFTPSLHPTSTPTLQPTDAPTTLPTCIPTSTPSSYPSSNPSVTPSLHPSSMPSNTPTQEPSAGPTQCPSYNPSKEPSTEPTLLPSFMPSNRPTVNPTTLPSMHPSMTPTRGPSSTPSRCPTLLPSAMPTSNPSSEPSAAPTCCPSAGPTTNPSSAPTLSPTLNPSTEPSHCPTFNPSTHPSSNPTMNPTLLPSRNPSTEPSHHPSSAPSKQPTCHPTQNPSPQPSIIPSLNPSTHPSSHPTFYPSTIPSHLPSLFPSSIPTLQPSHRPSSNPSTVPSLFPTGNPSLVPSQFPSTSPTSLPSSGPSFTPTHSPTSSPSCNPSFLPTRMPSVLPTSSPSSTPTVNPSSLPTLKPSKSPTCFPSSSPTLPPTKTPTTHPTQDPIAISASPSEFPTQEPSQFPTCFPSATPTSRPSMTPTTHPTMSPSSLPTRSPTMDPTGLPSSKPTLRPSTSPTLSPSTFPSLEPTWKPSTIPTHLPSSFPSNVPTLEPTKTPSIKPTMQPTLSPIYGRRLTYEYECDFVCQEFASDILCLNTLEEAIENMLFDEGMTVDIAVSCGSTHVDITGTDNNEVDAAHDFLDRRCIEIPNFPILCGNNVPTASPTLTPTQEPSLSPTDPSLVMDISNCASGQFVIYKLCTGEVCSERFWFGTNEEIIFEDTPFINSLAELRLEPFEDMEFCLDSLNVYHCGVYIEPSLRRKLTISGPIIISDDCASQSDECVDHISIPLTPCDGGKCVDLTLSNGAPWLDSQGEGCAYYADRDRCNYFGDMYANAGMTANDACCVCLGGTYPNPSTAPSSDPSTIPSRSPSTMPTVGPSWQTAAIIDVIDQCATDLTYIIDEIEEYEELFECLEITEEDCIPPSPFPSAEPTNEPSCNPTFEPSNSPTSNPSANPSGVPSAFPSEVPSMKPTCDPSTSPTYDPTQFPTTNPTYDPSGNPTMGPTKTPSVNPTFEPTNPPSTDPSRLPSNPPVVQPTKAPTTCQNLIPAASELGLWYDNGGPRHNCTFYELDPGHLCATQGVMFMNFGLNAQTACCVCGGGSSWIPTNMPSMMPTNPPRIEPSVTPSADPSWKPTISYPSTQPSKDPSTSPTISDPTVTPSGTPSMSPSTLPSTSPSNSPTTCDSFLASLTGEIGTCNTELNGILPDVQLCGDLLDAISTQDECLLLQSQLEALVDTVSPTTCCSEIRVYGGGCEGVYVQQADDIEDKPWYLNQIREAELSYNGAWVITGNCGQYEAELATACPESGSFSGTDLIIMCGAYPTGSPSVHPTIMPTVNPTFNPSTYPTMEPTVNPTVNPTLEPTAEPSGSPTWSSPSNSPTTSKPTTLSPTDGPSIDPTCTPTLEPSISPTFNPTTDPSGCPSKNPSKLPSVSPFFTKTPTSFPTDSPTTTREPTASPTDSPTTTRDPTPSPTDRPTTTRDPTPSPTDRPTTTRDPTPSPTDRPTTTRDPTPYPTDMPTTTTSRHPTEFPTTGIPTSGPLTSSPTTFAPSPQAPYAITITFMRTKDCNDDGMELADISFYDEDNNMIEAFFESSSSTYDSNSSPENALDLNPSTIWRDQNLIQCDSFATLEVNLAELPTCYRFTTSDGEAAKDPLQWYITFGTNSELVTEYVTSSRQSLTECYPLTYGSYPPTSILPTPSPTFAPSASRCCEFGNGCDVLNVMQPDGSLSGMSCAEAINNNSGTCTNDLSVQCPVSCNVCASPTLAPTKNPTDCVYPNILQCDSSNVCNAAENTIEFDLLANENTIIYSVPINVQDFRATVTTDSAVDLKIVDAFTINALAPNGISIIGSSDSIITASQGIYRDTEFFSSGEDSVEEITSPFIPISVVVSVQSTSSQGASGTVQLSWSGISPCGTTCECLEVELPSISPSPEPSYFPSTECIDVLVTFISTRNCDASGIHLAEIKFYDDANEQITVRNADVIYSTGTPIPGRSASNLIDNDLATTWFDTSLTCNLLSVSLSFCLSSEPSCYTFVTSPDSPDMDPSSWIMTHNEVVLLTQKDLPVERNVESECISLTQEPTHAPSKMPSVQPSESPSTIPSPSPTTEPSDVPTQEPSDAPTAISVCCSSDENSCDLAIVPRPTGDLSGLSCPESWLQLQLNVPGILACPDVLAFYCPVTCSVCPTESPSLAPSPLPTAICNTDEYVGSGCSEVSQITTLVVPQDIDTYLFDLDTHYSNVDISILSSGNAFIAVREEFGICYAGTAEGCPANANVVISEAQEGSLSRLTLQMQTVPTTLSVYMTSTGGSVSQISYNWDLCLLGCVACSTHVCETGEAVCDGTSANCVITVDPTPTPTSSPTMQPTNSPTSFPSNIPSASPTDLSRNPSPSPTLFPTVTPDTASPTYYPTWSRPTSMPSEAPTTSPSPSPSARPTISPETASPTYFPTWSRPTSMPSEAPTTSPSPSPSSMPTVSPETASPTYFPTWSRPTSTPSEAPTTSPSLSPSSMPTDSPETSSPTYFPTWSSPTSLPTPRPTSMPSSSPTSSPSAHPSEFPSPTPTSFNCDSSEYISYRPDPSCVIDSNVETYNLEPSSQTAVFVIPADTIRAHFDLITTDEVQITVREVESGTCVAGTEAECTSTDGFGFEVYSIGGSKRFQFDADVVSEELQVSLMALDGGAATVWYSWECPLVIPVCRSCADYNCKNGADAVCDGSENIVCPQDNFIRTLSESPTSSPTSGPTISPETSSPTYFPTWSCPTSMPSEAPTSPPSPSPSETPTLTPSDSPSSLPTSSPTRSPTESPSECPTNSPETSTPTFYPTWSRPTSVPSEAPTTSPSPSPTKCPVRSPTKSPTPSPTPIPTDSPATSTPTLFPTSSHPTKKPSEAPTTSPSPSPTNFPTSSPSVDPTPSPTPQPTSMPTDSPTSPDPTQSPTRLLCGADEYVAFDPADDCSNLSDTRSFDIAPFNQIGVITIPQYAVNVEMQFATFDDIDVAIRDQLTWQCYAGSAAGCGSTNMGFEFTRTTTNGETSMRLVIQQVPTNLVVYLISVPGGLIDVNYSWGCPGVVSVCRACERYVCANGGQSVCNGTEDVECSILTTDSPTTSEPSPSPTGAPTSSPTELPSDSPNTSSPTPFPTTSQPTNIPSESPTKAPVTSAPSVHPVTSDPSPHPTSSPSDSPSESPTESPMTSTPSLDPSTSDPSSPPTSSPTEFPSNSPTAPMTSSPSSQPVTSDPTPQPTPSPTDFPSTAPSELSCAASEYIFAESDCSSTSNSGTYSINAFSQTNVLTIPESANTIRVDFFTNDNAQIAVRNPRTFQCIAGTAADCVSVLDGIEFSTTSANGAITATLVIDDPNIVMQVYLLSVNAGTANLVYSWSCPEKVCRPCAEYGCQSGSTPSCDGSEEVTCIKDPTSNPTTSDPTTDPSELPTPLPTSAPTDMPSVDPTELPTSQPTSAPTNMPTTSNPTPSPTGSPTDFPITSDPSSLPTDSPSPFPTTSQPSEAPSELTCNDSEFIRSERAPDCFDVTDSREISVLPLTQNNVLNLPANKENVFFEFSTSDDVQFAVRDPRTFQCVAGTASDCVTTEDRIEFTASSENGQTVAEFRMDILDSDLQLYFLSFGGGIATLSYSWNCVGIFTSCAPCAEYGCENGALPQCDGSEFVICNTDDPTSMPTASHPTQCPTDSPTSLPTPVPSTQPTSSPTHSPTSSPTASPTSLPSFQPSISPTSSPSVSPVTSRPTLSPSAKPTDAPTSSPTHPPTFDPSNYPSISPTTQPTQTPTGIPTPSPTNVPTEIPSQIPSPSPTEHPSKFPTSSPTDSPTLTPSDSPSTQPSDTPTSCPTHFPTFNPSNYPTVEPTTQPTQKPTGIPTPSPTNVPTEIPSQIPSPSPTEHPSKFPTLSPSDSPTLTPSDPPATSLPTFSPSTQPTDSPTSSPTHLPTFDPSHFPTVTPTSQPTQSPTDIPTPSPTNVPTEIPTQPPTPSPTENPSNCPSLSPTDFPVTTHPSASPTTTMPSPRPTVPCDADEYLDESCALSNSRTQELWPSSQNIAFQLPASVYNARVTLVTDGDAQLNLRHSMFWTCYVGQSPDCVLAGDGEVAGMTVRYSAETVNGVTTYVYEIDAVSQPISAWLLSVNGASSSMTWSWNTLETCCRSCSEYDCGAGSFGICDGSSFVQCGISPSISPLTSDPTVATSVSPSDAPSEMPSIEPSDLPTFSTPTEMPTTKPTLFPTPSPSSEPSKSPLSSPPTDIPSIVPTTTSPSDSPLTSFPTPSPTDAPSFGPTNFPTPLTCSESEYIASQLVNPCEVVADTVSLDLEAFSQEVLFSFEPNVKNVELTFKTSGDAEFSLRNVPGSWGCLIGQAVDCVLSETGIVEGMAIAYQIETKGDITSTKIDIDSPTVNITTFVFSSQGADVEASWSWERYAPCGDEVSRFCEPCSSYACPQDMTPVCDGSEFVLCESSDPTKSPSIAPISLNCLESEYQFAYPSCSVSSTVEYPVIAGEPYHTFSFDETNSNIEISFVTAGDVDLSLQTLSGDCLVGRDAGCELQSTGVIDGMSVTYIYDRSNGITVTQMFLPSPTTEIVAVLQCDTNDFATLSFSFDNLPPCGRSECRSCDLYECLTGEAVCDGSRDVLCITPHPTATLPSTSPTTTRRPTSDPSVSPIAECTGDQYTVPSPDCETFDLGQSVLLAALSQQLLYSIPAGSRNLEVTYSSSGNVAIAVRDAFTWACFAGNAPGCPGGDDASLALVEADASVWMIAYEETTADVSVQWESAQPCGSNVFECRECFEYTCGIGLTPSCDGSEEVTCIQISDPPTASSPSGSPTFTTLSPSAAPPPCPDTQYFGTSCPEIENSVSLSLSANSQQFIAFIPGTSVDLEFELRTFPDAAIALRLVSFDCIIGSISGCELFSSGQVRGMDVTYTHGFSNGQFVELVSIPAINSDLSLYVASTPGASGSISYSWKDGNCETICIDCSEFVCEDGQQPICDGTDFVSCGTTTTTGLLVRPTDMPTTSIPTLSDTMLPTPHPTASPTTSPSNQPSLAPSPSPTVQPTNSPSTLPTRSPTPIPTSTPTEPPSNQPTESPTVQPTNSPFTSPTRSPTPIPTSNPTESPTVQPTNRPTPVPTSTPTETPSNQPTESPTVQPTNSPSPSPTKTPTRSPSNSPTSSPTDSPTLSPTPITCNADEYRYLQDLPSCFEENSVESLDMSAFDQEIVTFLPAGSTDVSLYMSSNASIVFALRTQTFDCLIGALSECRLLSTGEIQGMEVTYDRYVAGGQVVEEIQIASVTEDMNVWIVAFDECQTTLEYSWSAPAPCGDSPLEECRVCDTYTGCANDQIPDCDGSESVMCVSTSPSLAPTLMSKSPSKAPATSVPSTTPVLVPTLEPTTHVPTAPILCDGPEYYAFPVALDGCWNTDGTLPFTLPAAAQTTIIGFPDDAEEIVIELSADANADILLRSPWDFSCYLGTLPDCHLSSSGSHAGMDFTYSQYTSGNYLIERVEIPKATESLSVWIVAHDEVIGSIAYSWHGPTPCDGFELQCDLCSNYVCENGGTPICDGSVDVYCALPSAIPTHAPFVSYDIGFMFLATRSCDAEGVQLSEVRFYDEAGVEISPIRCVDRAGDTPEGFEVSNLIDGDSYSDWLDLSLAGCSSSFVVVVFSLPEPPTYYSFTTGSGDPAQDPSNWCITYESRSAIDSMDIPLDRNTMTALQPIRSLIETTALPTVSPLPLPSLNSLPPSSQPFPSTVAPSLSPIDGCGMILYLTVCDQEHANTLAIPLLNVCLESDCREYPLGMTSLERGASHVLRLPEDEWVEYATHVELTATGPDALCFTLTSQTYAEVESSPVMWLDSVCESSTTCECGTYTTYEPEYECGQFSGSVVTNLKVATEAFVVWVPTGAFNFHANLTSNVDIDLKVYESNDNQELIHCFAGYFCDHSEAGSFTYRGMEVYFSGDDRTEPVEEVLVAGRTTRPLVIQVKAYDVGVASLQYSWDAVLPCVPDEEPRCNACESYDDCPVGTTPQCDGSQTVSCVQNPEQICDHYTNAPCASTLSLPHTPCKYRPSLSPSLTPHSTQPSKTPSQPPIMFVTEDWHALEIDASANGLIGGTFTRLEFSIGDHYAYVKLGGGGMLTWESGLWYLTEGDSTLVTADSSASMTPPQAHIWHLDGTTSPEFFIEFFASTPTQAPTISTETINECLNEVESTKFSVQSCSIFLSVFQPQYDSCNAQCTEPLLTCENDLPLGEECVPLDEGLQSILISQGVSNVDAICTNNNIYYINDEGRTRFTCVGYSEERNAVCPNNKVVCSNPSSSPRLTYGSLQQQAVLVSLALQQPSLRHPQCPTFPTG